MRFGANPLLSGIAIALLLTFGCRTAPKAAPVDLSQPGWQLRQGQALWRSKRESPEIAGEVVLAVNQNGRSFLQFLKNPLPLLSADVGPDDWHIEFIPEKRNFSGRGIPPKRLLWLHLLRALQQMPLPRDLDFRKDDDGAFHIENPRTGERITVVLNG